MTSFWLLTRSFEFILILVTWLLFFCCWNRTLSIVRHFMAMAMDLVLWTLPSPTVILLMKTSIMWLPSMTGIVDYLPKIR
jgi:hypothetical protein